jgi:integral membrane sensor domain MASE1
MIVVTPLLLAFSAPRARTWTRARNVEVAGFAAVVALAGFLSFSGGVHWLDSSPLLLVLTLPPVIWAAFRFEQREVTATIAALCAIAVGFTVSGRGPLASESVDVSLARSWTSGGERWMRCIAIVTSSSAASRNARPNSSAANMASAG